MTLNTYSIPREGRDNNQYQDYITGLAWLFPVDDERTLDIDYNLEVVKTTATITGFELVTINNDGSVASKDISRFDFRRRFTPQEKVDIYTLANTDVNVRIYLDDVMSSDYIDLTLQETINGVQYLEANGVIAPGRAAQILA